jgi:NADH-quinone oxidoreductase subunit M
MIWYEPLHIHYHIGIDGISLAMILLTAAVVLAGILVSWNQSKWSKEFFILLLFLSAGAYGFFISLDLFTMFFFPGGCSNPEIFTDRDLGKRKKEYSAMKLALMLMGGSALVFVGLMGIYFTTGNAGSFDLTQISGCTFRWKRNGFSFPSYSWVLACSLLCSRFTPGCRMAIHLHLLPHRCSSLVFP